MFAELGKIRITVMVTFSTAAGYLLAGGDDYLHLLVTIAAVFLLSSGSSAMNHFQESDVDLKMDRTRGRPIPSGRATPLFVVMTAFSMWTLGFMMLYWWTSLISLLLGVAAVLWYNAVYTPLKRVTALAVLPGAIIGSIPPAIGWTAAGGDILHPGIISLALFFFIWQIPHFWLLLLMFDKDYRSAGFPTITRYLNQRQISRITFLWLLSLAVSGLLFFISGLARNPAAFAIILGLGISLIWNSRGLISIDRFSYRSAFRMVNVYVLLVILVLSVNKIFFM